MLLSDREYERAYRLANPSAMPFSPYSRRPELSNLWPIDQAKFRRTCDAALRSRGL
jgi:hypothetical protein